MVHFDNITLKTIVSLVLFKIFLLCEKETKTVRQQNERHAKIDIY